MTATDVLVGDVKRVATTGQGLVTAYVSIFNNTDRDNERVMPGAFTRTLLEWEARGTKIPMLWNHSNGIKDVVGAVEHAEEDTVGLKVVAQLDIDGSDEANMLFGQIKSGAISQYSFAYRVRNSRMAKDGVRELLDLDLLECSAVIAGSNPSTRTLAVKSATTRPDGRGIYERNMMVKRIDGMMLGAGGAKSSPAEMLRRIDEAMGVKSSSSDETMRRVALACVEAGMEPPAPPKPKRAPTYTPPSPLQDATGVFGYGNLTRPADTRRVEMKLHHGGGIGGEDLDATLAAAEQRLVIASADYEQAKLDVAHTKERIARYDEQHRGG